MICQQTQAFKPDARIFTTGSFRVRMYFDPDPLQQAGIFQRPPAAQHRMANKGLWFPKKSGCKSLADRLLLQKSEGPEAAVGVE